MTRRQLSFGLTIVLFLIAGSQFALAQHGGRSFGGGYSGGYGGLGGMRIGGGHQTRQSYGHNYNYNRSYGHSNYNYGNYGHQYRQTVPQYVAPRTNVVPRSQPAPRTYVAPKTNVVPRKAVAPPANKTSVATKVTPRPNSVTSLAPASKPVASSKPVLPAANSLPAVNKPAASKTAAAKPSKPKLPAKPNPGKGDFVANLTAGDLKSMAKQIGDRDQKKITDLERAATAAATGLIDRLPNAADLTPAQRRAIEDAVASGDAARLREALGPAADSPAGMGLGELTTLIDTLNEAADAIANNTFGGGELAQVVGGTTTLNIPPSVRQDMLTTIGEIAADQQWLTWILATPPGLGVVPMGPDVPLVLVPGLPDGWLMPLDGGAVMIGMGAPGDGIWLGMGDPLEVAGLPVPMEGAEPAAATTADFSAGQIILANPTTETVNYNLNQLPYQMAPTFEQTLPAGTTWTIEFDRGGSFGMARYDLAEGYYVFAITDRGWELYKRTFTTTLNNSANSFAFNYVIDDQQQTLNPGETHDLNGVFPPIVRFDNGSGQEQSRRLESGDYQIAVADDLTIDIYRAEEVSAPQAPQAVVAGTPAAIAPQAATTPAAAQPAAPVAAPAVSVAPAPLPTEVRPIVPVATATPASTGRRLPRGFTLFDPVPALTDARVARRLPPSFTLFRSAAEQMPVVAPR
jgi:hypothetical protein